MNDLVLLYVTCKDAAEAEMLGEAVVGQRLAACANILPGMKSVYWWQGKLERAEEAVLILKTRPGLIHTATEAIKARHSYAVPCVLPVPVGEGGNADYRAWLLAETDNDPT